MKFKLLKSNHQKGVSLPISLFVLISVMLAAATLIRSSELSVSVAGSVALRAAVGNSNDTAINTAILWLEANRTTLSNDNHAEGYRSAYPIGTVDYTDDNNWSVSKTLAEDSQGNVSTYQIERMCSQANTAYNGSNAGVQNICGLITSSPSAAPTTSSSSHGFNAVNFEDSAGGTKVYYKIITKTVGPKETRIITQAMVGIGA